MICILAFMMKEFSKKSSGTECDIYIQTFSDWTINSPGLVKAGKCISGYLRKILFSR